LTLVVVLTILHGPFILVGIIAIELVLLVLGVVYVLEVVHVFELLLLVISMLLFVIALIVSRVLVLGLIIHVFLRFIHIRRVVVHVAFFAELILNVELVVDHILSLLVRLVLLCNAQIFLFNSDLLLLFKVIKNGERPLLLF
jgi:hypothetical protein